MKKINNLLKTSLIVPLAFTASSFLNISQNPKLEEFNLKNKQVYEDFRNFSLSKLVDEEILSNRYSYCSKIGDNFYEFIYDHSNKSINLIKNKMNFGDNGVVLPTLYGFQDNSGNGLDDKDEYIQYHHVGNGSVTQDNLKVSEIDKDKQLDLAMEYVEALKLIMNNEGVKGY